MDVNQALAIRSARSIEAFCDGDSSFNYGDWKAWEKACLIEGRTISPREFKEQLVEERRARIKDALL